ncbi:MAG: hypothetical protein BWZ09_02651 [Alphaproteobacteria bacterium ADurb.BinA305]|nr:MAG: hypothetical protein BWZ09_02651 [Alphaproteobacteria bacterium ADurb.BinA305]
MSAKKKPAAVERAERAVVRAALKWADPTVAPWNDLGRDSRLLNACSKLREALARAARKAAR